MPAVYKEAIGPSELAKALTPKLLRIAFTSAPTSPVAQMPQVQQLIYLCDAEFGAQLVGKL